MQDKEKIEVNGFTHIRHAVPDLPPEEILSKSRSFEAFMDTRRSVRDFKPDPIPREVIENIIKTASTSPSGAHKQPWTFCAISDPELKKQIRQAAEKEEKESYESRMSERWLKDLKPMGTDMHKPFLETVPWIIVAFKKAYELDAEGNKHNNYYVNESVGLACGMLITAIHQAGLVTLTHTPSPMDFLQKILKRPANERAFLLLPVGKPEDPCYVPELKRKPLEQVSEFYV